MKKSIRNTISKKTHSKIRLEWSNLHDEISDKISEFTAKHEGIVKIISHGSVERAMLVLYFFKVTKQKKLSHHK